MIEERDGKRRQEVRKAGRQEGRKEERMLTSSGSNTVPDNGVSRDLSCIHAWTSCGKFLMDPALEPNFSFSIQISSHAQSTLLDLSGNGWKDFRSFICKIILNKHLQIKRMYLTESLAR